MFFFFFTVKDFLDNNTDYTCTAQVEGPEGKGPLPLCLYEK